VALLPSTDTESKTMTKPLIQIDDLVREMTDEEYADYLAIYGDQIPVTEP
jgi:hypothetical protein